MARKKSTPWRKADYTPFYLLEVPRHTAAEIRREYTRLRDIEMKRANRLEAAGLWHEADFIREQLPKLSQIKKPTDVANRLTQARDLYIDRHGAYNLTAVRKKQKEFERASTRGEKFSLGTTLSFDKFMQSWRTGAYAAILGASDAKDMYDDYKDTKAGGSFDAWYQLFMAGTI